MGFSLKVNTIHMDLYNNYHFKTNDLKTLIEQNIFMRERKFDLTTKIKN